MVTAFLDARLSRVFHLLSHTCARSIIGFARTYVLFLARAGVHVRYRSCIVRVDMVTYLHSDRVSARVQLLACAYVVCVQHRSHRKVESSANQP